jgi:hypothetical protein
MLPFDLSFLHLKNVGASMQLFDAYSLVALYTTLFPSKQNVTYILLGEGKVKRLLLFVEAGRSFGSYM